MTIVGVATLLIGASGVFAELQDALNVMWDVRRTSSSGILRDTRSVAGVFRRLSDGAIAGRIVGRKCGAFRNRCLAGRSFRSSRRLGVSDLQSACILCVDCCSIWSFIQDSSRCRPGLVGRLDWRIGYGWTVHTRQILDRPLPGASRAGICIRSGRLVRCSAHLDLLFDADLALGRRTHASIFRSIWLRIMRQSVASDPTRPPSMARGWSTAMELAHGLQIFGRATSGERSAR